jgi:hypothetical protein
VTAFNRNVALEFGVEGTIGLRLSQVRVNFRVKMSRSRQPNTAVIEAYNLSPSSIELLKVPRAVVRLLAGYGVPPIPRLIFQGTPIKGGITITKQGPDRIVKIEAADGGRAFALGRFELFSVAPTTLPTVFNALLASIQLAAGTVILNNAHIWPRGFTYSGPARDMLDRIADISLAEWYIRDNVLYVVTRNQPTPELLSLFSSLRGNLVGAPSQKDNGVQITGLLDASMRPGRLFQVVAPPLFTPVNYIANEVEFRGDSGWATPFYTIMTGKPLGAVT